MRSFTVMSRASLLALSAVATLGLGACAQEPMYRYQSGPIPPAPVQRTVVQQSPTRYVLQADALFDFDSAQLRPDGQRELSEVANKIRGSRLRSVLVLGYTDQIGSPDYNMSLSRRRAEAARQALIAYGIPASMIQASGRGQSDPQVRCDNVAPDQLISCFAPNRRVEIVIRAASY